MPDFADVARDSRGQKQAAPRRRAASGRPLQLDARSLFPVELTVAKSAGDSRNKRVSGQVMATVYMQMAALLRSGVPLPAP